MILYFLVDGHGDGIYKKRNKKDKKLEKIPL
jgi:hypothetical protein